VLQLGFFGITFFAGSGGDAITAYALAIVSIIIAPISFCCAFALHDKKSCTHISPFVYLSV
jgi:hypothetical protein